MLKVRKGSGEEIPLIQGKEQWLRFPDLQRGIAPLGPPAPTQPLLLGRGFAPPGYRSWPQTWDGSSLPFLRSRSLALSAAAPDLGRGVTPLGCCPLGMGSSQLLPLTFDVG